MPDGRTCAECRRRPPSFRRVITLGDYRAEEGLRAWILALKHGSRRDLARPLGRVLGARLAGNAEESGAALEEAWFVPVPLHPLRRLERGYDQARLLARFAAAFVGLPVVDALRRVHWTVPQGTPGARSRRANVRGAFVVASGAIARRYAGGLARRPVVLVDDVVTSGATVDACATALRRAGAESVDVLCLARAGPGQARPPRHG